MNLHQTENVLYRMSSLVLVLSVMCHDISLTWRGRGRAWCWGSMCRAGRGRAARPRRSRPGTAPPSSCGWCPPGCCPRPRWREPRWRHPPRRWRHGDTGWGWGSTCRGGGARWPGRRGSAPPDTAPPSSWCWSTGPRGGSTPTRGWGQARRWDRTPARRSRGHTK